jgi:hypothetical protein
MLSGADGTKGLRMIGPSRGWNVCAHQWISIAAAGDLLDPTPSGQPSSSQPSGGMFEGLAVGPTAPAAVAHRSDSNAFAHDLLSSRADPAPVAAATDMFGGLSLGDANNGTGAAGVPGSHVSEAAMPGTGSPDDLFGGLSTAQPGGTVFVHACLIQWSWCARRSSHCHFDSTAWLVCSVHSASASEDVQIHWTQAKATRQTVTHMPGSMWLRAMAARQSLLLTRGGRCSMQICLATA